MSIPCNQCNRVTEGGYGYCGYRGCEEHLMAGPNETTIQRGRRRELRLILNPRGGLDVREWFKASDGSWRPGREAINLSVHEIVRLAAMVGATVLPARLTL